MEVSKSFVYGLILSASIFVSCKDKVNENQENKTTKMVLLKVDYQSYEFEGGQLLELSPNNNINDSLPLVFNYVQPNDFGNLSLFMTSSISSDLVFEGSIVWSGLGERTYPATLIDSSSFPKIVTPLPDLDSSHFQLVDYEYNIGQVYYDSIWNGINDLQIVEHCVLNNSSRIGLFLYRPSVGAGDPADWDWYLLMKK